MKFVTEPQVATETPVRIYTQVNSHDGDVELFAEKEGKTVRLLFVNSEEGRFRRFAISGTDAALLNKWGIPTEGGTFEHYILVD